MNMRENLKKKVIDSGIPPSFWRFKNKRIFSEIILERVPVHTEESEVSNKAFIFRNL